MPKQEINFTEFKRRFYEWLFHYTTLTADQWSIQTVDLQCAWQQSLTPQEFALEVVNQ